MKILLTTLILVINLLFPSFAFGAIGATCVWEFRTTGNNDNGGGYTSGGTDYTLQDAAQLTLTDLACLDTSTTLTSVTGGFTEAMIGNLIHIKSGTNFVFTDGSAFYEITAYTDTNTVTIDRTAASPATDATAGTGSVGGCLALPHDANWASFVAGNTVYFKLGTYTLTSDVDNSTVATTALTKTIEGYKTARGDEPAGADRPTIAAAGREFFLNQYWHFKYFIVTTTDSDGLGCGNNGFEYNVKVFNSSTSAGRPAFDNYGQGYNIMCEAISTKGNAFSEYASGYTLLNSYAHDSAIGIEARDHNSYSGYNIINTVIETCGIGFDPGGSNEHRMVGSVIYNCTIGIKGTGIDESHGNTIINNIIDSNITGLSWTTEQTTNFIDYNCWNNNTADTSNATKGANAVDADPLLTVTLASGSDGTTDGADETKFESASNPFGSVTTNDCIIIHSGTSVTTGVYTITAVVDAGEITISAGATTGGSSIIFGIAEGADFTVGSGSPVLSAAVQNGTDTGLTGDYKWNIGVDQDDVTAAGGGDPIGWVGID